MNRRSFFFLSPFLGLSFLVTRIESLTARGPCDPLRSSRMRMRRSYPDSVLVCSFPLFFFSTFASRGLFHSTRHIISKISLNSLRQAETKKKTQWIYRQRPKLVKISWKYWLEDPSKQNIHRVLRFLSEFALFSDTGKPSSWLKKLRSLIRFLM